MNLYLSLHRSGQSCRASWWTVSPARTPQRMRVSVRCVARYSTRFRRSGKVISIVLDVSPLQSGRHRRIDDSTTGGSVTPHVGVEYLLWQRVRVSICHLCDPGSIGIPMSARRDRPWRHNSEIARRAALSSTIGTVLIKLDWIPAASRDQVVMDHPASSAQLHRAIITCS